MPRQRKTLPQPGHHDASAKLNGKVGRPLIVTAALPMKFLLALTAFAAPAFVATLVGTAANWAARVASPSVTAGQAPSLMNSAAGARAAAPVVDTRVVVAAEQPTHGLDVIRYRERTYLAFRSASRSEPHADASIVVISSSDERRWQHEANIALGTEVRDPAFLVLDGTLFVYANTLGSHRYSLQPQNVVVANKSGETWSAPRELDLPHQLVTHVGNDGGRPLMVVRQGAHSPFELKGHPSSVRILTTSDGYRWDPLAGQDDTGMNAGTTDATFSREEDGNAFGVVNRSLNGAQPGQTFVCLADSDAAGWDCTPTPLALSNPTTFRLGLHTYVLGGVAVDASAAQQVEPTSALGDLSLAYARVRHEVVRLASRQRCGIWRIAPRQRQLVAVTELPARGRECNARALVRDDGSEHVTVYAVGSRVEAGDPSLVQAKSMVAQIFRYEVDLGERSDPGRKPEWEKALPMGGDATPVRAH